MPKKRVSKRRQPLEEGGCLEGEEADHSPPPVDENGDGVRGHESTKIFALLAIAMMLLWAAIPSNSSAGPSSSSPSLRTGLLPPRVEDIQPVDTFTRQPETDASLSGRTPPLAATPKQQITETKWQGTSCFSFSEIRSTELLPKIASAELRRKLQVQACSRPPTQPDAGKEEQTKRTSETMCCGMWSSGIWEGEASTSRNFRTERRGRGAAATDRASCLQERFSPENWSMTDSTGFKLERRRGPEEKSREDVGETKTGGGCEIEYLTSDEALRDLYRIQHPGAEKENSLSRGMGRDEKKGLKRRKRIVFSGDSMMRQIFLRLVALLRQGQVRSSSSRSDNNNNTTAVGVGMMNGGSDSTHDVIVEQPIHAHLRYCLFGRRHRHNGSSGSSSSSGTIQQYLQPKVDSLQYQLWKYWKNERKRLQEGMMGGWKRGKHRKSGGGIIFEEGPPMRTCEDELREMEAPNGRSGRKSEEDLREEVLLELEYVWDPFQSRPYLEGRDAKLSPHLLSSIMNRENDDDRDKADQQSPLSPVALHVHAYMYWGWDKGLGPEDPQGIYGFLNMTASRLLNHVETALRNLPSLGSENSRGESGDAVNSHHMTSSPSLLQAWLETYGTRFYYPLTPLDFSKRPEDEIWPIDEKLVARNEIVAEWAKNLQERVKKLVDEEMRRKRWARQEELLEQTPAASSRVGTSVANKLLHLSAIDFPGIISTGGQKKLPRKDLHFMCGWSPKAPEQITAELSSDGALCQDPTNLALVQVILNLVAESAPTV